MKHTSYPTEPVIQRELVDIGRRLAHSMGNVIGLMLEKPQTLRPSRLDDATGIGKNIAYRVLKSIRCDDPITSIHLLPGPAPLRRLIRAASKRSVDPAILAEAAEAVDAFERFIRAEAGDRTTLDLMISGWLPEARDKEELLSKQAVFRGMSHIKGQSADVFFYAALLAPAADGNTLDGAELGGVRGFRRWRRDAELQLAARRIKPPAEAACSTTLDGRPIASVDDWILNEFSSVPTAHLDVTRTEDAEYYTLRTDALGMRSAFDVAYAELMRRCMNRYCAPDAPRKSGPFAEITLPTRLLVFDTLMHPEAYPGADPQLFIYDTGTRGLASTNDRSRDRDRLAMKETLERMGQGIEGLHVPEVPRYVEMLRHVFDRLGWDPKLFRAYRVRIEYPLYSAQIVAAFERPSLPAT